MKLKFGNINELVGRYSDMIIAALVVCVLAMIIIPIPPWLIDICLTI
ncbi:MAG: hypothetical protein HYU99_11840, partial [Deltaproteobacteria bacterium]|nr:hypothetical protein [Deltaproteobacteria bacterium]